MTRRRIFGKKAVAFGMLVLILLLGRSDTGFGQEKASIGRDAKRTSPLENFHWLAGTWRRETARSITYETWRRLSARTFEGKGLRLSKANGDTDFTEALLLVEMQSEVFYIAKVAENPYPVPFRLISVESNRAVFENAKHDFPQRITYAHNAADSLTVNVDGKMNGEKRGIEFRFLKEEYVKGRDKLWQQGP